MKTKLFPWIAVLAATLFISAVLFAQSGEDAPQTESFSKVAVDTAQVILSSRQTPQVQMNPEQLYTIKMKELETKAMLDTMRARGDKNQILVVSIVAIIIPFTMVVLVVFFGVRFKQKQTKQLYDLSVKFLEAGKDIPYELIYPKQEKSMTNKKLVWGAVLSALGLAGLAMGGIQNSDALIGVSFIPLMVGLSVLLVWKYEKKQEKKAQEIIEEGMRGEIEDSPAEQIDEN